MREIITSLLERERTENPKLTYIDTEILIFYSYHLFLILKYIIQCSDILVFWFDLSLLLSILFFFAVYVFALVGCVCVCAKETCMYEFMSSVQIQRTECCRCCKTGYFFWNENREEKAKEKKKTTHWIDSLF